jgi:N-acetyl sugar amidotransferase
MSEIVYCKRCIYDSRVGGISFDEEGICNYCRQIDMFAETYGTGTPRGEAALQKLIDDMKAEGKGRKYDCIVGVSGGTDSSYLLVKALDWGLRPLAVHYDNTWNAAIATENIRRVTSALGVDLYTHVIDNKEADALKLAFIRSGVLEFDADTDIAFVQVLRRAAAKNGVRYILEGHSFKAEGVSPVSSAYIDGAYIEDIYKRYGSGRKLKTFPNMTFYQFMKWALVYRQKFIRPLWYIDYSKEAAREMLQERTGWQYYGGHHLENRASSFSHTVWFPQRFNLDYRNLALSAAVRAGKMSRDEAMAIYQTPVVPDPELVAYLKKRLSLSDEEYERLMQGPRRTYKDFRTYKKRFERLRPMFAVLAKANLVPMSFYLKYCFPSKA